MGWKWKDRVDGKQDENENKEICNYREQGK